MQLRPTVGFAAKSSDGADGELKRPLDLSPISVRRIELRRKENRPQRFANVAIALCERTSNTFDQCRWWVIGNKITNELGGQVFCRRRMVRKNVEHRQAVFEPAPRRNLMAQDDFFTVVVRTGIEEKFARILTKHICPWSVRHCLG